MKRRYLRPCGREEIGNRSRLESSRQTPSAVRPALPVADVFRSRRLRADDTGTVPVISRIESSRQRTPWPHGQSAVHPVVPVGDLFRSWGFGRSAQGLCLPLSSRERLPVFLALGRHATHGGSYSSSPTSRPGTVVRSVGGRLWETPSVSLGRLAAPTFEGVAEGGLRGVTDLRGDLLDPILAFGEQFACFLHSAFHEILHG